MPNDEHEHVPQVRDHSLQSQVAPTLDASLSRHTTEAEDVTWHLSYILLPQEQHLQAFGVFTLGMKSAVLGAPSPTVTVLLDPRQLRGESDVEQVVVKTLTDLRNMASQQLSDSLAQAQRSLGQDANPGDPSSIPDFHIPTR